MVRLVAPVTGTWILAAEMAAASWVAEWSTTVKWYASLHPPRRNTRLYDSPRFLHLWQMGQPLSDRVGSDLSNHYNQLLPCPVGWDISKRSAQGLIYDPEGHAMGLDSVHYEMLAKLHGPASAPVAWPSVRPNVLMGGASIRHTTTYSRSGLLCPVEQAFPDLPAICPEGHLLNRSTRSNLQSTFLIFPLPGLLRFRSESEDSGILDGLAS